MAAAGREYKGLTAEDTFAALRETSEAIRRSGAGGGATQ